MKNGEQKKHNVSRSSTTAEVNLLNVLLFLRKYLISIETPNVFVCIANAFLFNWSIRLATFISSERNRTQEIECIQW